MSNLKISLLLLVTGDFLVTRSSVISLIILHVATPKKTKYVTYSKLRYKSDVSQIPVSTSLWG